MHLSPFGLASELMMSLLLEQKSGEINIMKRCEGADEKVEEERKHGERTESVTEDNTEKEKVGI